MPRLNVALLLLVLGAVPAYAADPAADPVRLTLKDHRFVPDQITVPAGERFKIEVVNEDDTPEEFESHDLKVEKIVTAGGKITLSVGPLKPGTYRFVGEYHEDTATGTIIAAETPTKE